MTCRRIGIGIAVLIYVVVVLHGCAEKKILTVGKPGNEPANLTFPNYIEIASFDGDSVENIFTRMIYEGKKELVFNPGTHTVEFRYKDIWDIDDDDHENIVSPYIVLQFEARPGSAYEISVNAPRDRQSAHKLASHFSAAIIDARTRKEVSRVVEDPSAN